MAVLVTIIRKIFPSNNESTIELKYVSKTTYENRFVKPRCSAISTLISTLVSILKFRSRVTNRLVAQ